MMSTRQRRFLEFRDFWFAWWKWKANSLSPSLKVAHWITSCLNNKLRSEVIPCSQCVRLLFITFLHIIYGRDNGLNAGVWEFLNFSTKKFVLKVSGKSQRARSETPWLRRNWASEPCPRPTKSRWFDRESPRPQPQNFACVVFTPRTQSSPIKSRKVPTARNFLIPQSPKLSARILPPR
jgi:hypothetical protein